MKFDFSTVSWMMGSQRIHPTSIVSPEAKVSKSAVIGPYCIVYPGSRIGDRTYLESHVVIGSPTTIAELGEENHVGPGSVIAGPPQDLKYRGEVTKVIIGNHNEIRECCTLNAGTVGGGGATILGDHNLVMSYLHIGHDCHFGNHIVLGSGTLFGGHVVIEDHVKIGGTCSFNQFVRIGQHAFIAGDATVNKDILPFGMAQGKYAVVRGTNKIGLERAGWEKEEIASIHRAIRILIMGSDTTSEAIERIRAECAPCSGVEVLIEFVNSSQRGIAK